MPESLNPYEDAKRDALKLWTRVRHWLIDFAKTHTTLALAKTLGASALTVVVLISDLPAFAWIIGVTMIVTLVVHAVYTTRRMKAQDRELRWAWVANKRLQQRIVDHQIAADTTILELMGERPSHRRAFRSPPPELLSALTHVRRQLADAEARAAAAGAVKEGAAADAQRRAAARRLRRGAASPAATGPDTEPIRARRAAREAERAELEAEIQALAT